MTFQDINTVTNSNVTNGTVSIQAAGVAPSAVVFNNSAVNYTVSNAGGNVGITGTTGLTKSGTGTVTLSSANTYTGNTQVTGGTLNLAGNDNANSILGGTAITVTSSATLAITGNTKVGTASGGTITINGGGILSLQDGSINTLTLINTAGGSLTLSSGSTLQLDINGNSALVNPNAVDSASVNTLTLNSGGNPIVSLLSLGYSGALANGTYTLLSYAAW